MLVVPTGQQMPLLQVCPLGQQMKPQTWPAAQHWLELALTRQVSPLLQQAR
jgi:hypothetical protein